jgi:proteasome lid subunit RPN8/RPN11
MKITLKYNLFILLFFSLRLLGKSDVPVLKLDKTLNEKGTISVIIEFKKHLSFSKKDIVKIEQFKKKEKLCDVVDFNISGSKQTYKIKFKPCRPQVMEKVKKQNNIPYNFKFTINVASGKSISIDFKDADMCKVYPENCQIKEIASNHNINSSHESNHPIATLKSKKSSLGYRDLGGGCIALKVETPEKITKVRQKIRGAGGYLNYRDIGESRFFSVHSQPNIAKYELFIIPYQKDGYLLEFELETATYKKDTINTSHKKQIISDDEICLKKLEELRLLKLSGTKAGTKNLDISKPSNKFSLFYYLLILLLLGIGFLLFKFRNRMLFLNNSKDIGLERKKILKRKEDVYFKEEVHDKESEIVFLTPEESSVKETDTIFLDDGKFALYSLNDVFNSTSVSRIFIHKDVAFEILEFVRDSVKDRPAPEVGGFLMGTEVISDKNQNQYDIIIKAFLPDVNPDFQNNVNIKFSPELMLEEFEYLKSNSGEKKLGWLHTHPGHGVFLSSTDIKSHLSAFPNPYQVAIVIESYDKFKTGIFSYKQSSNEINNATIDQPINFKTWTEFI